MRLFLIALNIGWHFFGSAEGILFLRQILLSKQFRVCVCYVFLLTFVFMQTPSDRQCRSEKANDRSSSCASFEISSIDAEIYNRYQIYEKRVKKNTAEQRVHTQIDARSNVWVIDRTTIYYTQSTFLSWYTRYVRCVNAKFKVLMIFLKNAQMNRKK